MAVAVVVAAAETIVIAIVAVIAVVAIALAVDWSLTAKVAICQCCSVRCRIS